MKTLALNLAFLLSLCLNAQKDTLNLASTVKDVTVFFEGAVVKHVSEVDATSGDYILRIDHLPISIIPNSIQVKSKSEHIKVLGVKHLTEQTQLEAEVRRQKKAIEKQMDELEFEHKKLKSKMGLLRMEEKFLDENSDFHRNKKDFAFDELVKMAAYYKTNYAAIQQQRFDIETQSKSLVDQMEALYKTLNQLVAENKVPKSSILVTVHLSEALKGNIVLSYFTDHAGWKASYDFRLKSLAEKLSVVYNADIYQTTGLDWTNVKLSLSTHYSDVQNGLPVQTPWILGQRQNRMVIQKFNPVPNTLKGLVMDQSTGEPVPFANVALKKGGAMVLGTTTDFDGKFNLKPVPNGTYDVEVSFVGYTTQRTTNVRVNGGSSQYLNFYMGKGVQLSEVTVIGYTKPLFEKDQTTTDYTITREELSRMAVRSPADVGRTASNGTFSRDDGYRMRGSRTGNNVTFVDGIKIVSETNLIPNEIKNNLTHFQFDLKGKVNILSDGKDYALKIKEREIEADFIHRIYPHIDPSAYLIAKIPDWEELDLISAPTNIYFEETFTHESSIDVNQTADTLLLYLGKNPKISFKKELKKENYDRRIFGQNVKEYLDWVISIRNNGQNKIALEVRDQYPISDRKSVDIEIPEIQQAKIDKRRGYLRWNIEMEPGEEQQLNYAYELKYPRYLSVNY